MFGRNPRHGEMIRLCDGRIAMVVANIGISYDEDEAVRRWERRQELALRSTTMGRQ